jgi:23S rRNA (guanosine2251-2'-O)-methyltransferase
MQREKIYIYGKHAVAEAVRNAPHVVKKVFIAPTFDDGAIKSLIAKNKIPTAPLKGGGPVGDDEVHQGLVAIIDIETLFVPFDAFINSLDLSKKPALALLGEVQDPHNVGAIIRSAAAMGFAGVLIPEHRTAPVTGAVVKTSAGMAFRIPLISIGNVNQTIRLLKEKGFWTYGLSGKGTQELGKESFSEPSIFIIGNEGKGIREKTEEICDVLLRIPMHTRTESLNAAASAAIVFYEWMKQHPLAVSS